ncbi:MBOAT family protein [Ferrovibrio terrae]|uniref:MBOAT family O-acyltransferase n=1 Tax=Ferrovibrio terrae TaxID=2594003 RepID=UPI003137B21F
MLFNSYEFLLFLPVTLAVFAVLRRFGATAPVVWLALASLAFYGRWHPQYLVLLLVSIGFNYGIGLWLSRPLTADTRRRIMVLSVVANLGLLAYYKYAAFTLASLNAVAGLGLPVPEIVLPLAISFFTFQQIAYVVDTWRSGHGEKSFVRYLLYVTFFPHLIAGPLVHHAEMIPQFYRVGQTAVTRYDMAMGITLFVLGLSKKVLLADNVARYASMGFDAVATGATLSFWEAWGATLAYTCQIYFDFSGYSDMAVGLGLLFGIRLPVNFLSPYKATSIIDFWRRWHITLSRFLRDYLYIALGGNRRGPLRRHVNLFITMLLGGLWHGAGWTFVIWGGLHGLYLIINHGWRNLTGGRLRGPAWQVLAWLLTFLGVVIAWVFFRAADLDAALSVLRSMLGLNGVALPLSLQPMIQRQGLDPAAFGIAFTGMFPNGVFGNPLVGGAWVGGLILLAISAPNTTEILNYRMDAAAPQTLKRGLLHWRNSLAWATATGCLFAICLVSLRRVSEFIYFNF